ncbi:MAG: hypothetical protein R3F43_22365 [bacterium]
MGSLVIEGGAPGTPVTVDGQAVGALPLPGPWTLPAGEHTVTIGSDERRVQVAAGQLAEVKLGKAAQGAGPKAAPIPAEPEIITRHIPGFPLAKAGYGVAGAGALALGLAVFFGLDADDLAGQARDLDRADPANTRADQHDLARQAEHSAFLANVLYGTGGVLLAGGAALILLGSDGPLAVAPSPGGVVVGGRF